MKLACTTIFDPRDRDVSGRIYYQLQAMESQVQAMHFLGPLRRGTLVAPLVLAKREYYRRLRKRYYSGSRDRLTVKDYARQITRKLAKLDVDIVLSPQSPNSQPIAYLDCRQPIVTWTDAPWAAVVDFYPEYSSKLVCNETLRDAICNERAALSRVRMAIYYSNWGAQCAIRSYGLDPAKVRVIRPGPALEENRAISFDEITEILRARPRGRCRLLFIGASWVRKGGDKALEIAKKLNAAGLATELVVVGCEPQVEEPLPEFVRVLGYISRATKEGQAKLDHLFKLSHFLLLPTLADCSPLVLLEANAFALPSLTTDVGGIPEIVRAGVNGASFPLAADPDEYCKYIEELFVHYDHYQQLASSALAEFYNRLNNRLATSLVINAMQEIV